MSFERFQYFNFKINLKLSISTLKLEYRFLVESTKSEDAVFLHKTALSEANVKTNRMVSTKWNTKNSVLPVTT